MEFRSFQITSANAAEMGRRSAEARRLRKQREAEQRRLEEEQLREALTRAVPNDQYVQQRLACVREQIKRLDNMLLQEVDPQRLDRLAAASARLSEIERQLAGRPGPGQFRPTAPRRKVELNALVPE